MSEFYEVDHPGPSLLENFLAINLQWGPKKQQGIFQIISPAVADEKP